MIRKISSPKSRFAAFVASFALITSYMVFGPSDSASAADPVTNTQITVSSVTSVLVNGVATERLTTKYSIDIEHPQYLFCSGACDITFRYKFTPGTSSYSFDSISLVSTSGVDFGSFYASSSTGWTTKTIYNYSALSSNTSLSFKAPAAAAGERISYGSAGTTKIFAVATPATHEFPTIWPDYVEKTQGWYSSFDTRWRGLEFEIPTRVVAYEDCQQIPFNIATIDFDSGLANTSDSTQNATVEITLLDPDSVAVGTTSINAGLSDWISKTPGEQVSYEACGLNLKMGVAMNYSLQVNYSYTQGGKTVSDFSNYPVRVVGGLKYTKINCLKGSYVKTIDAYQPECPAGYKQTNLPVNGNKLVTKSINCLKGKTVRVVTSATPSCPAGFTKTSLPVKGGKLQAQTITCVKGLKAIKVTKVLPTCPVGYRKA